MRILILAYSYSPALTPRAFRWTAVAEWMASEGHDVEVVCAKSNGLSGFQVIKGVQIHRVGGGFRNTLKAWMNLEQVVKPKPNKAMVKQALSKRSSSLVRKLYSFTLKNVMWPDFAAFWYFSAFRKSKELIKNKPYDAIISVSIPFTGHLVGLSLNKRYMIPWLVDIGDPFYFMTETPVNNHKFFGKLNFYSEERVLEKADVISVTTKQTRLEYYKHFPYLDANKISVIPPLFVTPDLQKGSKQLFTGQRKLKLVYAGTLYSRIRSPAVLLKFFASLLDEPIGEKAELHFFGEINDCASCFQEYAHLIGEKIFLHGLVMRDDALQAMKEAEILINLGNQTGYQLPSKVIEYVMLGKPVLNISPLPLDNSENLFEGINSILSVTEDSLSRDLEAYAEVRNFIEAPPPVSPDVIARFSEIHGLQKIGQNYIELLEEKISREPVLKNLAI